ncbi:DUF3224 domain-containing protein [Streptomyces sp. DSM 44917]|uniref:DUF3224 domain-containing protein n=1 Tax=Streptomyces boetiae TaxID=3075541 RepID=A0ABU2LEL6_9ACTN|nr:DUF3224 domain-containing protein [Streptomyces sp. DSM 44917]MDT0310025.1 DUF3224 domain-containing protein [Streptomyces sp. DSM 44917]
MGGDRALGSEGADGVTPRLARATVTNHFSGGIEAADTRCLYAIAYLSETTGAFTGLERVAGRLNGREGAFVLEERGSFEPDGSVRCSFEVVPGSGTGELAGLRGSGRFVHRQGEEKVAYTFAYSWEAEGREG